MNLGEEFEKLWESTEERIAARRSWNELTLNEKILRSSEYRRSMRKYGTAVQFGTGTREFGLQSNSNESGSRPG